MQKTTPDWKLETKAVSNWQIPKCWLHNEARATFVEDVTIETGQEKECCSSRILWVPLLSIHIPALIIDCPRPQSQPGVMAFSTSLEDCCGPSWSSIDRWCLFSNKISGHKVKLSTIRNNSIHLISLVSSIALEFYAKIILFWKMEGNFLK